MSKAVLLGPYVGSFTQEILVFRPYIKYITKTIDDAEIFVSSHSNRYFLYNWIKPSNFLPIYEHISRNEPGQTGFIYDDITKTEFNQITKKIRNEIPHDIVDVHALPYVKSTTGISYYQKVYSSFNIPEFDVGDDIGVVGIFNNTDESKRVYNEIIKLLDITVIGDMNNGIEKENVIMRHPSFENNYLRMFNYVQKAKLVVTNCSDWALICNCQGLPVFYWGQENSLFKSSGVLNFGNKRCKSICSMGSKTIAIMAKHGYDELYGGE